jgi:type IV fimbrial biogenesis protein FimT
MRTHTQRPQKGFTLLELLVAIAVLAILLGVGVPGFFEIIASNRITTQTNELVSALNYARSEAVKRGDPVSVCSTPDGATCAASNDWSAGWIVFTDSTGAIGALDAPTDELLQVWPATDGLALNAGGNFVRYAATGMATTATAFTLYKSGCGGPKARNISVATTGRVSSTKVDCP